VPLRRRIEQIALEVGDRAVGHQRLVDRRLIQRYARTQKRVHGPLPIRRHHDQAARGRHPAHQRCCREMHAGRGDVVAKHLPQRVIGHPADIGDAGAQRGGNGAGIGGRPTAGLGRRRHRGIQAVGGRGVDQRHRPLVHVVARQKLVMHGSDHIDDRVANAENVVAGGRHAGTPCLGGRLQSLARR
jgi:hypothetical protein